MPVLTIPARFDGSSRQRTGHCNRYDAINVSPLTCHVFRYESGAKYNARCSHRFDADNITPRAATGIRFNSEGRGLCRIRNAFDAMRDFEHPTTGVTAKYECQRSFDTKTNARFETIKPSLQQVSNRFDAILFHKYVGICGQFDANAVMQAQLSGTFDAMPGYQRTATIGRFDAFRSVVTALPIHKQAFFNPGWRILIRNTETDIQCDLGFIAYDAAKKAINDVDLPDGDYEITLLYSSLFWKDARDRVVRNVSIRSNEVPVLGLPPVLNLTSEVSDGITTISWSSNSGDYEDCEFGLWFAEMPPVVTFREPDQRIAYTAFDVDYSVRITQAYPLWCVIMAIKGNMRGPATEIYLEWSNNSPRRPDDQMAFDVFIDEKLHHLKNASAQVEGVEWNTSRGYW